MNKTIYKAGLVGILLGAGFFAKAQDASSGGDTDSSATTDTNPPAVGIHTDDPQETLDVRGTARITDLPTHNPEGNVNAIYNGDSQNKTAPFTATKTVVADDKGVLGSLPYILPAGDASKTSLRWVPEATVLDDPNTPIDESKGHWEAVPADTSSNQEPWNVTGSTDKANANNQDIYQNGKVTIGNVETADKKSAQDASFAVYNTDNVNKKMIALFNNNNERFYIGKGDGNRMIFSSDNAGSNGGQNGAGLTSKFVLDTSGSVRFGQDLNEFVGSKVFSDSESNKAYFIYDAAENKLVNRMVNGNEGENGKYIGLDLKVVDKQVSDPTLANIMAFSGSDNRIAMLGDVDKAANSARIFDVRAENGYRLRLQALQNQRVIIDGAGGTEIKHVSANDESNDVLVIASDGLVGKKTLIEPWKKLSDNDPASGSDNKIYYPHNVGIGNFTGEGDNRFGPTKDEGMLNIKSDAWKHIALSLPDNNENASNRFIISLTNEGNLLYRTVGDEGADNKMVLTREGDFSVGVDHTQVTDLGGNGGLKYKASTKRLGIGLLQGPDPDHPGETKGEDPTQSIDVEGTARLRGIAANNNATKVVVANDNGVLGYKDIANLGGGEKSPWFLNKGTVPANDSNSTDNIYHNGNVVIGNVSQGNIDDGKLGAKLLIAGGGTSQLRLAQEGDLTKEKTSTWDISTETDGDKKGISFTSRAGVNGRMMAITEDGSMYLGGRLSTITDAGSFHYDGSNKKLNLKRVNNTSVSADISGKVAIGFDNDFGTTMADDYALPTDMTKENKEKVKLAVNGAVMAGSFKGVNGGTVFPDYVFQKYYTGTSSIKDTYNFSTLSQVESFVKEYGHLPGYKSAAEIKEQGYVDLMDTQITNVEKIEELYLHSIEQDKEIKAKDAKIKELEARLERLEKLLK